MTNIIVEFNGLPGTGKTTIANAIIDYNSNSSYSFHEFFNQQNRFKIVRILCLLLPVFKIKNSKFTIRAFFLLISLNKINKERIIRVITLINFFDSYNKKSKKITSQIQIVDQGLIQQLISLFHDESMSVVNQKHLKKILLVFTKRCENIRLINIHTSLDKVIERLNKRAGAYARMEKETQKDMRRILKVQQHNFSIIRNKLVQLDIMQKNINASENVKRNSKKIMTWIEDDV